MDIPGNKVAVERAVPQPEQRQEEVMPAGTVVGAFAGYLRRPKPTRQGLTAMFFGENGPDADTICALHLTRFQDALVKVAVWGVKDKDGILFKSEDGKPPLLTEFIASIRRPDPSMHGQTAMFFGVNGPNADAISILNQSRLLDSLVFVEITKADPGMTPADIRIQTPEEALAEQMNRRTPAEMKEIEKQQKRAAEAIRLLRLAQFFQSEVIWHKLGTETQFQEWITQQVCCHPGTTPCNNTPVEAFHIPGARGYHKVPLCREHLPLWSRGEAQAGAQQPLAFLETRHTSLIQRWAEIRLREAMNIPAGYDPTPQAIYDWAIINQVANLIPRSFMALL